MEDAAAVPMDASGAALVELEKALENASETLAAVTSAVLDFTYDGQEALYGKVNEFVRDLAHMDGKAHLVSAAIPVQVLEAIDKGRNPEICTYQMLYVVSTVALDGARRPHCTRRVRAVGRSIEAASYVDCKLTDALTAARPTALAAGQ
jgi:Transcription factor subunit Med10 of Mediator complex